MSPKRQVLSGFFEFWTIFLSTNFLDARLIEIQVDNTHQLPVFGGVTSALLIGGFGRFVDVLSVQQQVVIQTFMTLVWCYEADGAVAMFLVVPVREAATH